MDLFYRATLLTPRGNTAPTNRGLPTMVDLGVLGWPEVSKRTGSGGLVSQTGPINTQTSARSAS